MSETLKRIAEAVVVAALTHLACKLIDRAMDSEDDEDEEDEE